MSSLHERKIKAGARPLLDEGEKLLAAFVARPRAWTEQAEFQLASPMALAVTQRRLISFRIGSPIGLGIGGGVEELVGAVPIADVDAIEVRSVAVGQLVTITVRGAAFKLEANATAGAKDVAAAFEGARLGSALSRLLRRVD